MKPEKLILLGCLLALWVFSSEARGQIDPDAEKIRKLVVKIQKEMKEIDQLLLRADQPAEASKKIDETIKNIEDLLRAAEKRQSSVVKEIEELVRLAKYQKSQQTSSPQSNSSRKPEQQQEEEQQKRSKEQKPGELQKQEQRQQDEPTKPERSEDASESQQKPARRPPPAGEKEQFQRQDVSDRWGILPPKEAEDLINALSGRIPERYRRWIEEYYRRVNRSKR
jgi:outer membrane biosynthesis protein TonB